MFQMVPENIPDTPNLTQVSPRYLQLRSDILVTTSSQDIKNISLHRPSRNERDIDTSKTANARKPAKRFDSAIEWSRKFVNLGVCTDPAVDSQLTLQFYMLGVEENRPVSGK